MEDEWPLAGQLGTGDLRGPSSSSPPISLPSQLTCPPTAREGNSWKRGTCPPGHSQVRPARAVFHVPLPLPPGRWEGSSMFPSHSWKTATRRSAGNASGVSQVPLPSFPAGGRCEGRLPGFPTCDMEDSQLAGQLFPGTGGRWEGNMEDGHSQVSWERSQLGPARGRLPCSPPISLPFPGPGVAVFQTGGSSQGNGRGTWEFPGHSQVSWEREGDGRGSQPGTHVPLPLAGQLRGPSSRGGFPADLGVGGFPADLRVAVFHVPLPSPSRSQLTCEWPSPRFPSHLGTFPADGRRPLVSQVSWEREGVPSWEGNMEDGHSQVESSWVPSGREMGLPGEQVPLPSGAETATDLQVSWEGFPSQTPSSSQREGDGRGTWKTATRRSAGNSSPPREMSGRQGTVPLPPGTADRPLAGQLGTGGRSPCSQEREPGTPGRLAGQLGTGGRWEGVFHGKHGRRPLPAGQLGTGGRWEGNMEDGHSQVSWEREGDLFPGGEHGRPSSRFPSQFPGPGSGRLPWFPAETATRRSAGNRREMGGKQLEDGHSQVSWEREGDGRGTWETATRRISWEREGDGRGTWKTATRRSAGNGREMGGEPGRRPLAGTGGSWEGNLEDGWEREGTGREMGGEPGRRPLAGQLGTGGRWEGNLGDGHSQVSWEREGDGNGREMGRGTWETATRRSAGNGREMGREHGRRPLAGQLGTGGRWEGNMMEDGHSQVSWEREGDGRGTWKTATRRSAGNGREMGGEHGRRPLAGQLGTGGRWEGNEGGTKPTIYSRILVS